LPWQTDVFITRSRRGNRDRKLPADAAFFQFLYCVDLARRRDGVFLERIGRATIQTQRQKSSHFGPCVNFAQDIYSIVACVNQAPAALSKAAFILRCAANAGP